MKFYLLLLLEATVLFLPTNHAFKDSTTRRYNVLNSYTFSTKVASVTASEKADSVYIASVNRIYRLDKNLKLLNQSITGPQNDSRGCTAPWCEGKRVNNVNKLLLVDHVKNRIISCGSLYQGSCEARDWKSLEMIYSSKDTFLKENKIPLRKMVCVSPDCNAVGLISQGFTVGSPVLYIATSMDNMAKPTPHTEISALGVYSLNHSGRHENSLFGQTVEGSSVMDEINQNRPQFQYIFETGDFNSGHIYFLFNSRQTPSVKGYATKIARICKRDYSFYSYVEMPLACDHENDVTIGERIITNAYFARRGDHDGTLYVTYNFLKHGYSTACDYDLKFLDSLFDETLESCWTYGGYLNGGEEKIVNLFEGRCETSSYLSNDGDVTQGLLTEKLSYFPSFVPTTSAWCGTAYVSSKMKRTKIVDGNIIYQHKNVNFSNIIVDDIQKVAFIGSIEGKLLKINLKEKNIENRNYATVDIGEPLIGNLVWGIPDSSHPPTFYAHTANQVFHMTTAACRMYKDCQSCFASSDVYCGWCTLKNKCLARNECLSDAETNMALRWLKPGKDTCIRNQNKLVFQRSHNGPIDISISNLPPLGARESYSCVYEGVGNISKTATTRSRTLLRCNTPSPSQLPMSMTPSDSDFVEVPLKIRYNNNVDILTTSVTFYDCEQYATRTDRPCYDCLKSKWNCLWSVSQHRCVPPNSIGSRNKDIWIEHDKIADCPRVLDLLTPHPLIPVKYPISIILYVVNMPQISTSRSGITCHFELDATHHYNAHASIVQGDVGDPTSTNSGGKSQIVQCHETSFNYDGKKTQLVSKLTLTWDTDKTVDFKENEFTFYKCSATRDDCSKCLSADREYHCGWCQNPGGSDEGRCQIPELCNNDTFISQSLKCPVHEITGFSPSSGPIKGGTLVEIYGKNMGASYREVSQITVAGVECVLVEEKFVTSTKIVCKTGRVASERDGQVVLTVRNRVLTAKSVYKYKSVKVTMVEPLLGPQAGGTLLTVRGLNLDVGSLKRVNIEYGADKEMDCTELTVVNDTVITCLTPEVKAPKDDLHVNLVIDGNYYLIPQHFYYKPNPQVTKVETLSDSNKLFSYMGGGRQLFIYGSNFKSVQKPTLTATNFALDVDPGYRRKRQLLTRRNIENSTGRRRRSNDEDLVFEADCKVEKDTKLICQTPRVKVIEPPASHSPTNSRLLLTSRLTLTMDNVEIELGELTYLDNPDFHLSSKNSDRVAHDYLKFYVDHLAHGEAVEKDEIFVWIGKKRCIVESIRKPNEFLCEIPEQPKGDQLKYTLNVTIGFTTWSLGSMSYLPTKKTDYKTIIIVVVAAAVSVIVLFVVIYVLCKCRQKCNKATHEAIEREHELDIISPTNWMGAGTSKDKGNLYKSVPANDRKTVEENPSSMKTRDQKKSYRAAPESDKHEKEDLMMSEDEA